MQALGIPVHIQQYWRCGYLLQQLGHRVVATGEQVMIVVRQPGEAIIDPCSVGTRNRGAFAGAKTGCFQLHATLSHDLGGGAEAFR